MEFKQFVLNRCASKTERETAGFIINHYERMLEDQRVHYERLVETQYDRISDLLNDKNRLQREELTLRARLEDSQTRDCTKITFEQIRALRRPDLVNKNKAKPNKVGQLRLAQTLRETARQTVDRTVAAKMLTRADQLCAEVTKGVETTTVIKDHVIDEENRKAKRQFIQKVRDEVVIDNMIRSKKSLPETGRINLHDKQAFNVGMDKGKLTIAERAVRTETDYDDMLEEVSDELASTASDFTSEEEEEALARTVDEVRRRAQNKSELQRNVKLAKHVINRVRTVLIDDDEKAMLFSRNNPSLTDVELERSFRTRALMRDYD